MHVCIHRPSTSFRPSPVELGTALWHLVPVDETYKLDTFLQGGLWFSRIDKFGDLKETKEGKIPKPNLGLLEKIPEDMTEWVKEQYRLAVLRSYASCWTKGGPSPTRLMWDTKFGGYGKGVGIRTTPEAVREAISPYTDTAGEGPIYFGSIEYIDHGKRLIQQENTLAASFALQLRYRDENEARALIHSYGSGAAKFLVGRSGPFGPLVTFEMSAQSKSRQHEFQGGYANGEAIVLGIDPHRFIEEIVLGPDLDSAEHKAITERVRSYGLASKIRSSCQNS